MSKWDDSELVGDVPMGGTGIGVPVQRGMKVSPQDQAIRDSARLDLLEKEKTANPNDPALDQEVRIERRKQGAPAPVSSKWDDSEIVPPKAITPTTPVDQTDWKAVEVRIGKSRADQMRADLANGQSFGRQLGITGRNTLEAVGSLPAALGNAMEYLGVKGTGGNPGTRAADYLNLPKPETGTEKFWNELATTLLPGVGGYSAGAKLASKLPSAVKAMKGASFIEPTVGGAAAGALTSTSKNEDPRTGAAIGALMGPAGKVIGDAGGWVINKGRRLFENAGMQAVRRVQELAGPNAASQAATLRALRGDVQGELPTSGMAATVDSKMTYQKELQEQARRRLSGAYTERDKVNAAARMAPLERIATPGREGVATRGGTIPESRHEAYRSGVTKPLYNSAEADRVTMTPELEALVAGAEARPAVVRGGRAFRQEQTNAEVAGQRIPQGPVVGTPGTPAMPEVRDSFGMVTRPAVPEVPAVPGNRSIQDLQQVKDELSARINGLWKTDENEARRLITARNQLNRAMEEASPTFSQANTRFRELSIPQNQADIAQVLVEKLRNAKGGEQHGAFLEAIQNAPQVLRKADQQPRFRQIGQVMSKAQMDKIEAVTRSLRREAEYAGIGRTELPGTKSAAQEIEEGIPSLLNREISWTKKGLRKLGLDKDVEINKIIDEATLHPDRMAQLLERATPSDRIKILSAIREGNPKGASIGLVAGQE